MELENYFFLIKVWCSKMWDVLIYIIKSQERFYRLNIKMKKKCRDMGCFFKELEIKERINK